MADEERHKKFFERAGELKKSLERQVQEKEQPPPRKFGKTLTAIGAISLCLGIPIIGYFIYKHYVPQIHEAQQLAQTQETPTVYISPTPKITEVISEAITAAPITPPPTKTPTPAPIVTPSKTIEDVVEPTTPTYKNIYDMPSFANHIIPSSVDIGTLPFAQNPTNLEIIPAFGELIPNYKMTDERTETIDFKKVPFFEFNGKTYFELKLPLSPAEKQYPNTYYRRVFVESYRNGRKNYEELQVVLTDNNNKILIEVPQDRIERNDNNINLKIQLVKKADSQDFVVASYGSGFIAKSGDIQKITKEIAEKPLADSASFWNEGYNTNYSRNQSIVTSTQYDLTNNPFLSPEFTYTGIYSISDLDKISNGENIYGMNNWSYKDRKENFEMVCSTLKSTADEKGLQEIEKKRIEFYDKMERNEIYNKWKKSDSELPFEEYYTMKKMENTLNGQPIEICSNDFDIYDQTAENGSKVDKKNRIDAMLTTNLDDLGLNQNDIDLINKDPMLDTNLADLGLGQYEINNIEKPTNLKLKAA